MYTVLVHRRTCLIPNVLEVQDQSAHVVTRRTSCQNAYCAGEVSEMALLPKTMLGTCLSRLVTRVRDYTLTLSETSHSKPGDRVMQYVHKQSWRGCDGESLR